MLKTILLVDDNWNIRKFASLALTSHGYSVVEAENGLQGLECLEKNSIDLILTDWNMPVMSGHEMIQQIDKRKSFTQLPCVVLSALIRPEDNELPENHNIFCWLRKPCRISALTDVIANIFSFDEKSAAN